MPTIVDALVVQLGIDTSAFTKGQKDASASFKKTKDEASDTAKAIEVAGAQAAEFFVKLRSEALRFFAVLAGAVGVEQFISKLTDMDVGLWKISTVLGMNAQKLAEWGGANQRFGGTVDDVNSSFQAFTSSIEDLKTTGTASFLPYLYRLQALSGKQIDLNKGQAESFLDIADAAAIAVKRYKDPALVSYLLEGIHVAPGLVPFMLQGSAAIRKQLEEQKKLVPSPGDLDAARKRLAQWEALIQQVTELGRSIATGLSPAIIELLKNLDAWTKKNQEWLKADFTETIKDLLTALKGVATALDWIVTAMGGWEKATTLLFDLWLGEKFLKVLANIGLLRIALAGSAGSAGGTAAAGAPAGAGLGGLALGMLGLGAVYEANKVATGGVGILDLSQRFGRDLSTDFHGLFGMRGTKASSSGWEERDVATLMGMGWSHAAAIGIVANIERESGGNIHARGDNGAALGLAQWHADRQVAFARWSGHSIDQSSRDEQLAFINYELRHGDRQAQLAGQLLAQAKSAQQAAAIVTQFYERPKDIWGQSALSAQIASMIASMPKPLPASQIPFFATHGSPYSYAPATHTSSVETHVGSINVSTDQKTAQGIVRDIKEALQRDSLALAVNYGIA